MQTFGATQLWDLVCNAYRRQGLPIVRWSMLDPRYRKAWEEFTTAVQNTTQAYASQILDAETLDVAQKAKNAWEEVRVCAAKAAMDHRTISKLKEKLYAAEFEASELRIKLREMKATRQRSSAAGCARIGGRVSHIHFLSVEDVYRKVGPADAECRLLFEDDLQRVMIESTLEGTDPEENKELWPTR